MLSLNIRRTRIFTLQRENKIAIIISFILVIGQEFSMEHGLIHIQNECFFISRIWPKIDKLWMQSFQPGAMQTLTNIKQLNHLFINQFIQMSTFVFLLS